MAIIKKKDLKNFKKNSDKQEIDELVDADGSAIEGDEPQGTTSQIHVAPQQTTDDFVSQAIQPNRATNAYGSPIRGPRNVGESKDEAINNKYIKSPIMPNSNLEGKYFTPSDKVLNKIEAAVMKYDVESGERGFARAKQILAKKRISYSQMKRLKNYFDTYEGDGTDVEYKLIGGKTMKKWLETALSTGRDVVHDEKKARMDAGEENQFIQTHEKDKDNADPTRVRMAKIHKGSKLRNIMANDTIYEEIENIKYLINFMDNKKTQI